MQCKNDLAAISVSRMSASTLNDEKILTIVKNLAGRGESPPRKVQTLLNTIKSLFSENLSERLLASLVKELEDSRYIKVIHSNASYDLPQLP